MIRRTTERADEGSTLPLVSLGIVVLLGFVSFAVDLGFLYNIRRSAQDAADAGALAAALEINVSDLAMYEKALEYSRANLINQYTDPEWDALWQVCLDLQRPASFAPLFGNECISVDHAAAKIRVRVPEQEFTTFFIHLLGTDTLGSSAVSVAEVRIQPVLPFGVAPGAPVGEQCMAQPPGGHALLPCSGPTSGNFGSILSNRYTSNCSLSKATNLTGNMLLGIDHPVSVFPAGGPPVLDDCFNRSPNTVSTDTGNFAKEAADGLVIGSGDFPGIPGLLTRGSNSKRPIEINGQIYGVDNKPLWDYLIPNATVGCSPGGYDLLTEDAAALRMSICLNNWTAGELFDGAILDSPRFGVVMEFVESTPPSGTSTRTIKSFPAIFVHRLGFTSVVVSPGPSGLVVADDKLEQVTSFTLPPTPLIAGQTSTEGGVLRPKSVALG